MLDRYPTMLRLRRPRRARTGTVCVPLSGWRGERHPDVRDPTPAELLRRCPFCGQLPGPTATEWCPSFDMIVQSAATGAAER